MMTALLLLFCVISLSSRVCVCVCDKHITCYRCSVRQSLAPVKQYHLYEEKMSDKNNKRSVFFVLSFVVVRPTARDNHTRSERRVRFVSVILCGVGLVNEWTLSAVRGVRY